MTGGPIHSEATSFELYKPRPGNMRWAVHVASMRNIRNEYKIVVRNREENGAGVAQLVQLRAGRQGFDSR
jgi:hypothetical protein